MSCGAAHLLTPAAVAPLLGVSERQVQRAVPVWIDGGSYKGVRLPVVRAQGRGGIKGNSWLIDASVLLARSSPPATITAQPAAAVTDDLGERHHDPEVDWKLSVVLSIRRGAGDDATVRQRIAEAARTLRWPSGKRRGRPVSATAIATWLDAYERHGMAGLARKRRADRGDRKHLISRAWSAAAAAAGVPLDERQRIARLVDREIASEIGTMGSSWRTVQQLVAPKLERWSRTAGMTLQADELHRLCLVPRNRIEQLNLHRKAAIVRRDAGLAADRLRPRIKRSRDGLLPMEMVACDVHHVDILKRREDGSLCTPKMVAWYDLATNRAFVTVFLMPKGQMIRREHVLLSLQQMLADPAWGVPTVLYGDNGGEYNFADLVQPLSRLKSATGRTIELRDADDLEPGHRERVGMIKGRPYNPQGKVIESLFAALERRFLSRLPGYIAGDRMRKRTENHGKAPAPYGGTIADFERDLGDVLAAYHAFPQQGFLADRTPAERFAGFVAGGWQSVVCDFDQTDVVFSREEHRTVAKGGVIRAGGEYRHDDLIIRTGEKLVVRVPVRRDPPCVFVFDEFGDKFICAAGRCQEYDFRDPAGAVESDRQARRLMQDVRALEAQQRPVDGIEELRQFTAARGPMPVSSVGGTISVSPEFAKAGAAGRALPPPAAPSQGPEPTTEKAMKSLRFLASDARG